MESHTILPDSFRNDIFHREIPLSQIIKQLKAIENVVP
jgi:hypothetical protein